MAEIKVLFCCMGNVCRSPMAEGFFRRLVDEAGLGERIVIDSAGTHTDLLDSPPDPRAQQIMAERGIDISGLRARPIKRADFERFDLILAMDGQNFDMLRFTCPKPYAYKIGQLLDYAPAFKVKDIPDPLHGDEETFVRVADMVEAAAAGLLERLRERLENQENA
ncbi:low molecular weight protein-tyrosine-phosphatase [Candidatus Methylocalor cossyra]|uniref:protein-tyrosine-phosphatase n=1 Tax=Candidatus Methylocalor cossyra TaxID=3108543 RepID=A0ABM9NE60_9GAMM